MKLSHWIAFRFLLLLGLLSLVLSACGPSAEDLAATQLAAITQTQAALPTATPTPSATPTDIPTITPTETLVPTATATDTPTPEPKVVVSTSGETPAYSGPGGEPYVEVVTLTQGQELDYVGKSEDGQWIAFAITDYQNAWVAVEHLLINFDVATLEEIAAPATPETKYKLLIVNNMKYDLFVTIPEAGIPATKVEGGKSLVFTLVPQTYSVYIGDKIPTRATVIALSSDKTILLQPKENSTWYNVVVQ
ncbi:MAG: hypothetical protein JXB38_09765 [Anaerolineales bacterium]|nr:hypothetical protein [Anaerolineales bacterium]